MLSVDEARSRILDAIHILDPLELAVTEAHGCVLAETISSIDDLPSFSNSALDGYALRAEDTARAAGSSVALTVSGEAAAGRPFGGTVKQGECVRIFTGAAIPDGADSVVGQEE